MTVDTLVDTLGGDPQYVKFLLVERPYIKAALVRMTAVIDEEARLLAYPSSVGNALHNDIIELETWLACLSKQDREVLEEWAAHAGRQVYGSARMGKTRKSKRVMQLIKEFGEHQNAHDPQPPAGRNYEVSEGDVEGSEGVRGDDSGLGRVAT
jgi:hypothetical protein